MATNEHDDDGRTSLMRMTKDQLVTELLDAYERSNLAADAHRKALERHRADRTDLEAEAIARCASALDEMMDRRNPNAAALSSAARSDLTARFQDPGRHPVGRVLEYLRLRYGLPDPYAEARRLDDEAAPVYREAAELRDRVRALQAALGRDVQF